MELFAREANDDDVISCLKGAVDRFFLFQGGFLAGIGAGKAL